MGIKVESMEPEVWDAVRAIARDEVSIAAQSTTAAKPQAPVVAVISAPKPKAKPMKKSKKKGKAIKAGLIALAILFVGSGSVLAEEPLGLINPRNLDLTQTNAVWAFETTISTPLIVADSAEVAEVVFTGEATIGDGTGAVTFNSGTYDTSNSDDDMTNVGDIAVDTISADDGSSFAISDDFTNAGNTIADLGIVTTVDVNGGSIDGAIIGAASAAAVTGSTITGTTITDGTVSLSSGTFSGISDLGAVTTADINAGTVDAVIGGSTPAAITGTTITGTTFTDQSMSVTAGVFSGIADLGVVATAAINGGTIDSTTIGVATPDTGAFTTLATSDTVTITRTTTANGYTNDVASTWTAGTDMASGGSNGIYAISKPIEDVQNAYSIRGRTDLREATADVSVNQTHTIDGLINLNETYYYFVDDNMSVIGGAVHGNAAGGIGGTGTGALGGATLNVIFGMWGPTATADVDVETNFIKVISHAGTTVDYGLNIESSSDMNAGILLNSHSSNSPATMDVGLEMISASGKMVYGIDMSAASFTTGDIRVDGAQVITSGAWSLNSEVYAGVPGTLPVGSMAIGTGKVYIKLTNNGNEADWQYIDTTDD